MLQTPDLSWEQVILRRIDTKKQRNVHATIVCSVTQTRTSHCIDTQSARIRV